MKVLIGCENSGTVRESFKKLGHEAYSCDLLPSEISGNHYQMDIIEALGLMKWDLIILHPTCTKLCVSGNHVYAKGKPKWEERKKAIEWTQALWNLSKAMCDKVCLENPVGVLSTQAEMGVKPQYVQPYEFGHAESKKTGLWLHNLSKLKPTNVIEKPECGYWNNQTQSGQNKLGPSKDRWKIRSKTYQGLADAMAEQWGNL